jgi:DASH complex subunit DAD3
MSDLLAELTVNPAPEILDALRGLERKTSLVFTLLKASVYSIVLNQQIRDQDEDEMESGGMEGSDGGGLSERG